MTFNLIVDDKRVSVLLDQIGPGVRESMKADFAPIVQAMESDARARAAAHIHSLGKNPGKYAASIKGGVSVKNPNRVTGYLRSGSPLAHLMELGFTIKDMIITAVGGSAMKFEGEAGVMFAHAVHRHQTTVKPYPAIFPAFEAQRGAIDAALTKAAATAAK